MTHLSDFSYLERCVITVYITSYLVYSIYQNDKFRCMSLRRLFGGELRSIITYIMFIMMTTQAAWDFFATYVKYKEGFMMLPTGSIVTKPFQFWSPEDQKPVQPMDYMQCVTFSFHTSVFFLMQCFWNYLSNNVAKKSFMSSFEFKFYILWALGSMAMFPVLQWRFRNDELLSEVVPQFAYGGEVLITACLGIRSNFRFKRIIAGAKRSQNSSHVSVVNRLTYFKEMNFFLTIGLFSYGASFVILCADGLTPSMTINSNKLATDILICNANMCVVIIWLLFISIFHPRRHYAANNALSSRTGGPESYERSKNDVEMTTTAPGSQQRLSQRVTNFVANNSHQPSAEKYEQEPHTPINENNSGVFMRSMAPMHVDYPASVSTETAPLTHSAASPGGSVQGRKISVEDPYSSQSVLFSMVDPRYPSSQLQAPRYPSPMSDVSAYHTREPSPLVSQVPTVSQYDTRSAYGDIANDYHDDTTAQARPPPPLPATAEAEQPGRERMVTDWLWQSPSGRKQT